MEDGDDPQKLGSKAIFQAVRDEVMAGRDALVFVHGYDHTFREAAGRAVQLQQWLAAGGKDMVLLMFTWPSAGAGVSARTYADDRDRARLSGPALGRAVLKATDFIRNTERNKRCDARIHLKSEEHTSELQSLMSNSYAVFCLKTKTQQLS